MDIVTTNEPNFLTVSEGFTILSDGFTVTFEENDGVRLVNDDDTPVVEFEANGDPYQIKISDKDQLSEILKNVEHVSYVKYEDRSLTEVVRDESIDSRDIMEMYNSSESKDSIKVRTVDGEGMDESSKATVILDSKSGFSDKKAKVSEASDIITINTDDDSS